MVGIRFAGVELPPASDGTDVRSAALSMLVDEFNEPDSTQPLTLTIHAEAAEKRAGQPLFDDVDWSAVLGQARECSPGDCVRILHAVLRHKASEAARGEKVEKVITSDLEEEVERFKQAQRRIRAPETGNYV